MVARRVIVANQVSMRRRHGGPPRWHTTERFRGSVVETGVILRPYSTSGVILGRDPE
jgi:hypothetical protein